MGDDFIDLLDPASIDEAQAAAKAERRECCKSTIARIEAEQARLRAEYPACPELDAVLAMSNADLAKLRAELDG